MIIEQNGEGSCHLVERGKVLVNELGGGGAHTFFKQMVCIPTVFRIRIGIQWPSGSGSVFGHLYTAVPMSLFIELTIPIISLPRHLKN